MNKKNNNKQSEVLEKKFLKEIKIPRSIEAERLWLQKSVRKWEETIVGFVLVLCMLTLMVLIFLDPSAAPRAKLKPYQSYFFLMLLFGGPLLFILIEKLQKNKKWVRDAKFQDSLVRLEVEPLNKDGVVDLEVVKKEVFKLSEIEIVQSFYAPFWVFVKDKKYAVTSYVVAQMILEKQEKQAGAKKNANSSVQDLW